MDWRRQYGHKLLSPDEAVRTVQSGDSVWVGMFTGTPETLARALLRRRDELQGVRVYHDLSPFEWGALENRRAFAQVTPFAGPKERAHVQAGIVDYLPHANFRESFVRETMGPYDWALLKMSPPDENGYLSFGAALWINRTCAQNSRRVVAEVDERLIRTYGTNFWHISQIDALCEHDPADDLEPAVAPRSPELTAQAEVICTLIAEELVRDGDTLQVGIGDVSASMALYLHNRRALGMQTEFIPGGVIDLVEQGVITGERKRVAPGTVVGAAFAVSDREELRRAHLNPRYELWDFCQSNDLRTLAQEHSFVAINNALQVDVTGQVTAETLNGRLFSGPGGQTVFAIAASYSEGGRSVIAVPSSTLVRGERCSRIVAGLAPGSMVTVPRTFVDYVVTEYGIATVRGKTVRERVREMIAVAHPDVRGSLREEAKALYGV